MSNLISNITVTEQQGKYVSKGIQLYDNNSVIRLVTSQSGKVTIERSIIGADYAPVDGFEVSVVADAPVEIGISDAKRGQYIRIVSTAPITELTALV